MSTASASVEVACDRETAFKIFTAEIGAWWRRGTMYWIDADRAVDLRFEPHVGGRLIEVYDLTSGEGHEIGRVKAWEPGERLVFTWRMPNWPDGVDTDVEVRFTDAPGGTLVRVEHSGWDRLGADGVAMGAGYSRGWGELLDMYAGAADRS